MINIATLEVIRQGTAFNVIRDAIKRHLGLDLIVPA